MPRSLLIFGRMSLMGLQSFGRHLWLTIAAVTVMVATITVALVAIVANITAQNLISHVSQNLKVTAYIESQAPAASINSLRDAIATVPAVTNIEYIDSESALERLTLIFADEEAIQSAPEYLGDKRLPASFRISLDDLDQVGVVHSLLLESEFDGVVESIGVGQTAAVKTIDRAQTVSNFIVNLSLGVVFVLGAVACLIIFNTIRIAIFSRRQEIEIMRLVGARSNFVRGSFLIEASLSGLIAGLIAAALVYIGIEAAGEIFAQQPEFSQTYEFLTEAWTIVKIFAASIGAGVFVGILSAYLATDRYLRRY